MANFTHLHLHTEYSLLDGFAKIDKVLDRAKEYGMDALAITDHGVMFGVLEFYKQAKKRGIKPIIGCEVYVSPNSHLSKKPEDKKRYHLVLLAENQIGYQNLVKIDSEAFVNGFYYKPRISKDFLRQHSEGIICLSACLAGEVQDKLKIGDYAGAKEAALEHRNIFGPNNYFLELQDHGIPEQKLVNEGLIKISKETGIPLVATNDVHYTDQEDSRIQDVLLAVGTNAKVNDPNRMRFPTSQFYLKTRQEMEELFGHIPEALDNTNLIAQRCQVDFDFNQMHLPYFQVDQDHGTYLRELVYKGLEERYEILTEEIKERADFELQMLAQMGFEDYFLIVWDFIDFAKKNGIPVGPGRGSAAGSLVAYALGITGVDPIEFDLLFERFLNPERVSMPDIDIDFCFERREEVIEYVRRKYGDDRVAQIVTFGTMAARNAIRDIGRALDIELSRVDKIAKEVPQEINMTIDKALEVSEDFRNYYTADGRNKQLIDIAKEVEGMPRHTSTHAAGVVIASKPIDEFVPLLRNGDQISTQFNMTELEELGLLKMDFLGLRTLTVIADAVKLVKHNRGLDIDIDNIDLNDPKTLKIFHDAETVGIFQFESEGMRNFLRRLRPTRFDDLIAANSLFRPGPMNEIPNYINYRHNPEKVTYLHPLLKEILEPTYGTIVYQEQVMQIVQKLGGFTLGEADNLRRAMGKKKMAIMEEYREYFVNGRTKDGQIEIAGALRNGVAANTANKIYDLMIDFAKYAFNKSHSAAYSYIAMQTAYLKAYYPQEFMAALLSSVMGTTEKVYLYIKEAKNMEIDILLPNVNFSYKKFSVEDGKIRIGLNAIKSVGYNMVEAIVKERLENGKFQTFESFIQRMLASENVSLTKSYTEAFILSGALDGLGLHRSQMMQMYPDLFASYSISGKNNLLGQKSLFDLVEDSIFEAQAPDVAEFPKREFLNYEKEYLGVYISDHPYGESSDLVADLVNFSSLDIAEDKPIQARQIVAGGIVASSKKIITKKNQTMAFLELEDSYGTFEVVVFPRQYEKYRNLLIEDKPILVRGNLQVDSENKASIIANDLQEINSENFFKSQGSRDIIDGDKNLYLKMKYKESAKYQEVKQILNEYPGQSVVYIYFDDIDKMVALKDIKVDLYKEELINKLKYQLGQDSVLIKREE